MMLPLMVRLTLSENMKRVIQILLKEFMKTRTSINKELSSGISTI